jgi:hypothetical protein
MRAMVLGAYFLFNRWLWYVACISRRYPLAPARRDR